MNIRVADWSARMCSRGVGVRERVLRPAREGGRRVVIEWGLRRGLRAPPKKLVVLDERSRLWDLFRGGGGEDYVHEAGFDVEEEKPWDWGHDGCHT